MTWSSADIDVGIRASLIQSYPILLSMLLSINRNQLSVHDAHCALALTSHPLMAHLAISSICHIFGVQTDLYRRIRSHRRIISVLGALILLLWFALSLALRLSNQAFSDSREYGGWDFMEWLRNLISYIFTPVPVGGAWIYALVTASIFLLCLFRRRSQLMADLRAHREGAPKLWSVPWTFVKCAWYIPVVMGARLFEFNVI